MSEIPMAKPKKSLWKLFLLAFSAVLLLLIYGAGVVILPITILTNYRDKDCNSVLHLNKLYTSVYPMFIQDTTLSTSVRECEAFAQAVSSEEMGIWHDAYDAYQRYSTTYPSGLYATEAHEHGALALLNLTKEQIDQKQYEEALTKLNQLVSDFSNTSSSIEAWDLLPSTYASWGTGLREDGNFERSEQVLSDFKTWSQNNQITDAATEAQRELAQTYLAWALEFQSQKQYENALAKLDLAVSADPQSQFDSARQVKAGQSNVYVDWGNELLEQKQFELAIKKFELAVSKSEEANTDAKDALANGQIQWARDLSTTEDFQAGLQHMQIAKDAAVSETMKKSVETALQDTYLAFSNSSGIQARQAMKEALKAVCQKHKAPDLPIFGLNQDLVHFAIYGDEVEEKLPESLVAKTPGEMHYVACIKTSNQTIETRYKRQIVLQTSRGYYYVGVQQFRVQILWNVDLLQVNTGKSVAETTLEGGTPPPFPEGEDDSGNYFYGPSPMEELAQWLQEVTQ